MNQNPAILFSAGTKGLETPLILGTLNSFSFFTVCQQLDTTTEQSIISLENDTAIEMVITNQRMALLDAIRYANYSKKKNFPRIYSYTQNKTEQTPSSNKNLSFGRTGRKQSLPVAAYNGLVPEVILFNRNLSFTERLRVESYLALIYGVSISQENPVHYLNSKGEVIWDADVNTRFSQNIAGVGRDDASGLNQQTSESLQTPGLMKIVLNKQATDNSFLIWGDDGGELAFSDKENTVRNFGRHWKASAFGLIDTHSSVDVDVLSLSEIDPLTAGEFYWIMVDRSGQGTYPAGKTDFVRCSPMSLSRRIIHFDNVPLSGDSSRNSYFTLLAAPALFTKSAAMGSICQQAASGKILTDIAGGQAPYYLTIRGVDNTSFQKTLAVKGNAIEIQGIDEGEYILLVTDAQGQTSHEKIRVSNQHTWKNTLSTSYTLGQDEAIELDASQGMPVNTYFYKWKTPEGTTVSYEKIFISQPGSYLLSVTDETGCSSTNEVTVNQTGASEIKKAELFPNPSTGGWFVVRINLENISNVHLSIADLNGKLIKEADLKNEKYYWYENNITTRGVYTITLIAGKSKKIFKLLVQ